MFFISIPYFFPDFHSKEKTCNSEVAEFTSTLEFSIYIAVHKHSTHIH